LIGKTLKKKIEEYVKEVDGQVNTYCIFGRCLPIFILKENIQPFIVCNEEFVEFMKEKLEIHSHGLGESAKDG